MFIKKTIVAIFAALISLSALNVFAEEPSSTQTIVSSSSETAKTTETELSILDKVLVLLGLTNNEEVLAASCERKGCCSRGCGLGKIR